jgi:hypothetical protein
MNATAFTNRGFTDQRLEIGLPLNRIFVRGWTFKRRIAGACPIPMCDPYIEQRCLSARGFERPKFGLEKTLIIGTGVNLFIGVIFKGFFDIRGIMRPPRAETTST